MSLTTTNKREKRLIWITGGIMIATLLYSVVLEPRLQQRDQIRQQRRELELKLHKLQADFQVKDQIDLLYDRIEPMLRSDQSDQQEISHFTRQLHDLYGPLSLTIKSVKILPLIRETYTRKLMIKIEMAGKVEQIVNFITLLTQKPEPIKIEQFQLQATDIAKVVHATFLVSKVVACEG